MNASVKVAYLWLAVCFGAPASAADAVITRPTPDALASAIEGARSLMGHETLATALSAVKTLDSRSLATARHRIRIDFNDTWRERVNDVTTALPSRTPDGERLLVYAIQLQIEMLDGVLSARDQPLREQLRRERTMVSVASPGRDRIFGDARDRYVAEMIRGLKDLAKLQRALGAEPGPGIGWPAGHPGMGEIEAYVLDQLQAAADRATKVH